MVGLLQPLIALVQILLLSRDRVSNHFDHRFEAGAMTVTVVVILSMAVTLITSLVIITIGAHCCSRLSQIMFKLSLSYPQHIQPNGTDSVVRLFLTVSCVQLN